MKTTAYLQLTPIYDRWGKLKKLSTSLRQTHPGNGIVGGLTLKLNINVPDNILKPLPVEILVPENAVDVTTVEVTSEPVEPKEPAPDGR